MVAHYNDQDFYKIVMAGMHAWPNESNNSRGRHLQVSIFLCSTRDSNEHLGLRNIVFEELVAKEEELKMANQRDE